MIVLLSTKSLSMKSNIFLHSRIIIRIIHKFICRKLSIDVKTWNRRKHTWSRAWAKYTNIRYIYADNLSASNRITWAQANKRNASQRFVDGLKVHVHHRNNTDFDVNTQNSHRLQNISHTFCSRNLIRMIIHVKMFHESSNRESVHEFKKHLLLDCVSHHFASWNCVQ